MRMPHVATAAAVVGLAPAVASGVATGDAAVDGPQDVVVAPDATIGFALVEPRAVEIRSVWLGPDGSPFNAVEKILGREKCRISRRRPAATALPLRSARGGTRTRGRSRRTAVLAGRRRAFGAGS